VIPAKAAKMVFLGKLASVSSLFLPVNPGKQAKQGKHVKQGSKASLG
jgi:hypothetical protein